ncbi:Ras- protein Rab-25 [Blyttiomyces sp. JEL0837]|nr:Ras- protein Rab-25 [Blyttiomyces sp. JEL0837]
MILGDSGVGKSQLFTRLVKKTFNDFPHPTAGIDFATHTVKVNNGQMIKAQIVDTSGLDRFRPIIQSYWALATGAIIVYDITNRESFTSVRKWVRDFRAKSNKGLQYQPAVMVVGNKCEQESEDYREVSAAEAQAYALAQGFFFMEVSALENLNVDLAFGILLTDVYYSIMDLKRKQNAGVSQAGGGGLTRSGTISGSSGGADEGDLERRGTIKRKTTLLNVIAPNAGSRSSSPDIAGGSASGSMTGSRPPSPSYIYGNANGEERSTMSLDDRFRSLMSWVSATLEPSISNTITGSTHSQTPSPTSANAPSPTTMMQQAPNQMSPYGYQQQMPQSLLSPHMMGSPAPPSSSTSTSSFWNSLGFTQGERRPSNSSFISSSAVASPNPTLSNPQFHHQQISPTTSITSTIAPSPSDNMAIIPPPAQLDGATRAQLVLAQALQNAPKPTDDNGLENKSSVESLSLARSMTMSMSATELSLRPPPRTTSVPKNFVNVGNAVGSHPHHEVAVPAATLASMIEAKTTDDNVKETTSDAETITKVQSTTAVVATSDVEGASTKQQPAVIVPVTAAATIITTTTTTTTTTKQEVLFPTPPRLHRTDEDGETISIRSRSSSTSQNQIQTPPQSTPGTPTSTLSGLSGLSGSGSTRLEMDVITVGGNARSLGGFEDGAAGEVEYNAGVGVKLGRRCTVVGVGSGGRGKRSSRLQ